MGRIVMVCVVIGIMGYLGYRQMYGHATTREVSAPKQRLENVQNAANRIEKDQQKAADEALEKTKTE